MHSHLRPDILRLIWAELPPTEAAWITQLSVTDIATHLETYTAIWRLDVCLPSDLQQEFVTCLLEQLECSAHGASDDACPIVGTRHLITARFTRS